VGIVGGLTETSTEEKTQEGKERCLSDQRKEKGPPLAQKKGKPQGSNFRKGVKTLLRGRGKPRASDADASLNDKRIRNEILKKICGRRSNNCLKCSTRYKRRLKGKGNSGRFCLEMIREANWNEKNKCRGVIHIHSKGRKGCEGFSFGVVASYRKYLATNRSRGTMRRPHEKCLAAG